MKILLVLLILFFSMPGVYAETAQYYNETSGQMEVPITAVGADKTINLISYCSLVNTDLSTFNSIAVNWDKVSRLEAGPTYYTAYYYDGVWYGAVADVEPIEAGVGYEYERAAGASSATWIYDTEFYCEDCGENGAAIVETVYVSPDYEDVALLFYIFMIPIMYLFIAFKKRVSTISLSIIFLIFAFFVLLFQVIEISVNIIYLIIFLFLFMTSIAGITKQGVD